MITTYAETIPNLKIDGKPAPYPVVNERGVRASAGIMFVIGFSSFFYILATKNYSIINVVVPLFWLDFFLKSVFTPSWSIFGFFGELLVKNQKPEYVGAIQKRFAWFMGLGMASLMMIVAIFLGIKGWAPFSICMTCLLFMWLESSCGICVGCSMYKFADKKGLIKNRQHKPACPGGVCSIKK